MLDQGACGYNNFDFRICVCERAKDLRNLAVGVGMKIRPHVILRTLLLLYIHSTSVLKTKIANEQMIHDFTKCFVYFEDEAERSSSWLFTRN